jgi:hypothetical protein
MQQSMEEDNISHISPYHVELLYSVLSEHITTDFVTTSVHTISNRKLSATYLTKRNAGNNVNPQVAKIDPTHECIVCAYDPRFTVQCISSVIESRYQCYWFLSVVVAETTKHILSLTCVNNIPRLWTCILYHLWHVIKTKSEFDWSYPCWNTTRNERSNESDERFIFESDKTISQPLIKNRSWF